MLIEKKLEIVFSLLKIYLKNNNRLITKNFPIFGGNGHNTSKSRRCSENNNKPKSRKVSSNSLKEKEKISNNKHKKTNSSTTPEINSNLLSNTQQEASSSSSKSLIKLIERIIMFYNSYNAYSYKITDVEFNVLENEKREKQSKEIKEFISDNFQLKETQLKLIFNDENTEKEETDNLELFFKVILQLSFSPFSNNPEEGNNILEYLRSIDEENQDSNLENIISLLEAEIEIEKDDKEKKTRRRYSSLENPTTDFSKPISYYFKPEKERDFSNEYSQLQFPNNIKSVAKQSSLSLVSVSSNVINIELVGKKQLSLSSCKKNNKSNSNNKKQKQKKDNHLQLNLKEKIKINENNGQNRKEVKGDLEGKEEKETSKINYSNFR